MDEAMLRTIKITGTPYKVMTLTCSPNAAQQVVLSWLEEQQDGLAANKKIGLTNYIRLAAVGLPVLLWHVEEARLKADSNIPKTRAEQEEWLRMAGIAVDPEASGIQHR